MLELYHGPTAAFKDFGAEFLAQCSASEIQRKNDVKRTILVATSGDTGGQLHQLFTNLKVLMS